VRANRQFVVLCCLSIVVVIIVVMLFHMTYSTIVIINL
jgi:hypothetical protein